MATSDRAPGRPRGEEDHGGAADRFPSFSSTASGAGPTGGRRHQGVTINEPSSRAFRPARARRATSRRWREGRARGRIARLAGRQARHSWRSTAQVSHRSARRVAPPRGPNSCRSGPPSASRRKGYGGEKLRPGRFKAIMDRQEHDSLSRSARARRGVNRICPGETKLHSAISLKDLGLGRSRPFRRSVPHRMYGTRSGLADDPSLSMSGYGPHSAPPREIVDRTSAPSALADFERTSSISGSPERTRLAGLVEQSSFGAAPARGRSARCAAGREGSSAGRAAAPRQRREAASPPPSAIRRAASGQGMSRVAGR